MTERLSETVVRVGHTACGLPGSIGQRLRSPGFSRCAAGNRLKPGLLLQSRAGALSISGLIVSWSLPHDGRDGGPGQHPHDQPFPDSLWEL